MCVCVCVCGACMTFEVLRHVTPLHVHAAETCSSDGIWMNAYEYLLICCSCSFILSFCKRFVHCACTHRAVWHVRHLSHVYEAIGSMSMCEDILTRDACLDRTRNTRRNVPGRATTNPSRNISSTGRNPWRACMHLSTYVPEN